MTTQTTGEALANEGMSRATAASDPRAIERLDQLIAEYAATGQRFSSNTLRDQVPAGVRPNAIGGRFRRAAEAGVITHVGWETSTKENTRGHPVRVWQGVAR
ncbi:hypothetical protein [Nocardiopsis alba]|jgi:hypothetical protein